MPDPSTIAGTIAQRMAASQQPPSPTGDPGQGSTTLTPDYVNQNKKDIQGTFQQSPWEQRLRAFFGMKANAGQ